MSLSRRRYILAGIIVVVVSAASDALSPLVAQEAALWREVPEPTPRECEPITGSPPAVSVRDRQEAAGLAASAREASLLGDLAVARDLLSRSASLDPTVDHVVFLLARTLEELGELDAAVEAYCRYVGLATNEVEAEQARDHVRSIAPPWRKGIPDSAVNRFNEALAHYDSGRFVDAERAFTAVIAAAPTWAAPYYNRALIRARSNRRPEARADLEQYIALGGGAESEAQVRRWILQLAQPATYYSPGLTFALGLVPGAGHFHTGRPVMGSVLLTIGAGAAATGLLYRTTTVECLGVPDNGVCPPDQVRDEVTERPYLVPALGVVAAASILGAIDAALGARRHNARGPVLRRDGGRSSMVPEVLVTGRRVDIALVRIRF